MNIANRFIETCYKFPNKKAVVYKKKALFKSDTYDSISFFSLEKLTNHLAKGLQLNGVTKGNKCLIFVRPSVEFPAIVFALFKIGAIPVLIDPGMGKDHLLNSIQRTKPDTLIGVPKVHMLRNFYVEAFKSIKLFVTTSKFSFGQTKSLNSIIKTGQNEVHYVEPIEVRSDDIAAILFTSGGTGIPKGVVYTHDIFNSQIDLLKSMFNLDENDIDLPGFPLFSLFTLTFGMTSCIPEMNPSKPATADPVKLVQNILDVKPTFIAGSPAIWEKVATYCKENKLTLPSVKYLVMFGAPVATHIHDDFFDILPSGTTYTPYGATEALPVTNASANLLLKETKERTMKGHGTCIGIPVEGIQVKIIKIKDEAIYNFEKVKELPPGNIGEIIVSGPVVTSKYSQMAEETANAKIYQKFGKKIITWHRMGDLGYFDDKGLLWFCGRKSHRVEADADLLTSVQCESIFNQHPEVKRSALILINDKTPGIVIERHDKKVISGKDALSFKKELLELAGNHQHTKKIVQIFQHKNFPVDVRHNIKIDRIKLSEMFSDNS